jgi:hypothetical protein
VKDGARLAVAGGVVAIAGIGAYFAFRKPADAAPAKGGGTGGSSGAPSGGGAGGKGNGSGASALPAPGSWCTDAQAKAQGLDPQGIYKADANGHCVIDTSDHEDPAAPPASTWTGFPIPGNGPYEARAASFQPTGCKYGYKQALPGPLYICGGAGPFQQVADPELECDSGKGTKTPGNPLYLCT